MKVMFIRLSVFAKNLCFAKVEELNLSNKVLIGIELPKKLSHSGNLLILKFDDWYFFS